MQQVCFQSKQQHAVGHSLLGLWNGMRETVSEFGVLSRSFMCGGCVFQVVQSLHLLCASDAKMYARACGTSCLVQVYGICRQRYLLCGVVVAQDRMHSQAWCWGAVTSMQLLYERDKPHSVLNYILTRHAY